MVTDINEYRKRKDLKRSVEDTLERLETTSNQLHRMVENNITSLYRPGDEPLHTLVRFIYRSGGLIEGQIPSDLTELLKMLLDGRIQIYAAGMVQILTLVYIIMKVISYDFPQLVAYEFRDSLSETMREILHTDVDSDGGEQLLRASTTMTDHTPELNPMLHQWVKRII